MQRLPMNSIKAYQILEFIVGIEDASIQDIRAQYRRCALKYHPDKCKLPDAAARFCEIKEAYTYLESLHNTNTPNCEYMDDDDDTTPDTDLLTNYKTLVGKYIATLFRRVCDTDTKQKLARLAISKILGLCEKKATEYVRKLDCTTLSKIYEIMYEYKDAFHLSAQWLEVVKDIIAEKKNGEQCVLLNPFLEDLQADNLYRITENGRTYIVPLWHPELIYDNSGVDFIVRCCPVLPDNMELDEDNNVYVRLQYTLAELWGSEAMVVPFGNTTLSFYPSALYLSRKPQTICIQQAGISRINQTNVFDNSRRTNVLLVITITGP